MIRTIEDTIYTGMTGYIYGIQCCEFIKIGIARNITDRLRTLKLYNPFECKVVLRRFTKDCRRIEIRIHQLLESRSVGREWFRISPLEARAAFKVAKEESEAYFRQLRLNEYERRKEVRRTLDSTEVDLGGINA